MAAVPVAVIAMAMGTSLAATASPPPAAAFGALPAMAHVALSPDGRTLAWAVDQGEKGLLAVAMDLASGQVRRSFPLGRTGKLRDLAWADDDTLLVDVSIAHSRPNWRRRERDRWEIFRTIAVDLHGGEPRLLLMDDASRGWVTGAEVVSVHGPRRGTIVMASFDFQSGRDVWAPRLFVVDLRTGKGHPLEWGADGTQDWLVDARGEPLVRSDWDSTRDQLVVLARRKGAWTEIHRLPKDAMLTLVGLSADGGAALAIGAAGEERSKLWSIALDGSGATVLAEDPGHDVESVILDPYDRRAVGVVVGSLPETRRWLDPQTAALRARLAQAFPGRTVAVGGRSRDGQRLLVGVSSPAHAPVHYLVDLANRTADVVGETYPALVDVPLGEVRAISYAARDGTEIPALLTIPPGTDGRNLPLVVMPHGGPEARDTYAFDWWVQFLATRGYAVLQPQFRGSIGLGRAFREAGHGQWGGLMQHDVTDGVKAMIAQGIADPRRVCIVGASYGGYAALAGATMTPELYACAASVNGIADLPMMLGHENRDRSTDGSAYWRERIGSVFDRTLGDRSPARLVARVRAPVLLLHGADDVVVPIAQSETMARALKLAGKAHEFVRLPGEDHWLSRAETRTRVLQELDVFLARHLNPAGAAGPASN